MKSARRSGIPVLHASPVTAQSRFPVWQSVNQKPSLTQMDGSAYAPINNFFSLSLGKGLVSNVILRNEVTKNLVLPKNGILRSALNDRKTHF